jgi:hypothetical protein
LRILKPLEHTNESASSLRSKALQSMFPIDPPKFWTFVLTTVRSYRTYSFS